MFPKFLFEKSLCKKFTYFLAAFILLFLNFALLRCQLERDTSIVVQEPYYKDPTFWPEEIKEIYAEYTSLAEKEDVCNLVSIFMNHPNIIEDKIREKACIPDINSLLYLLEEGKIETVGKLIENIYLPNDIDPTDVINSWIGKTEGKIKHMNALIEEKKYKNLIPKYHFMNFDNKVEMIVKLNEEALVPEKLSINCYKDMLIFSMVFQKKGVKYIATDRKYLFDEVDGDCEYNFNQYGSEVEIDINKKNKMKKWDALFRKA